LARLPPGAALDGGETLMNLVTLAARSLASHGLVVACLAYLLSTLALKRLFRSRSERFARAYAEQAVDDD
jgi:hypothetical protein